MSRRWRVLAPTRHRRADPPWVTGQVPPTATPIVLRPWVRRRAPALGSRRGRFWSPSLLFSTAPHRRSVRRLPLTFTQRGQYFNLPPFDTPSIPFLVRSRVGRLRVLPRRGRILTVLPEILLPSGPAPLVPTMIRRHRTRWLLLVRGRFSMVPMEGAVPPPYVWPPRAGNIAVQRVAFGAIDVQRAASGTITVT